MMGASEARWVARQVSLWTVPTLVSSAAAFVMVLDMTVGVVRAPQVSPLVVERVLCTRTSSTKIRVMIESESDGGRQCFQAASDRASTGQLWRVHTGAVVPSREVGAQGVLKVAAFPSLIWGAQAYKKALGVN